MLACVATSPAYASSDAVIVTLYSSRPPAFWKRASSTGSVPLVSTVRRRNACGSPESWTSAGWGAFAASITLAWIGDVISSVSA